MNIEQIKARLDEIRAVASNDELAHIKEDLLYAEFVDFIRVELMTTRPDLSEMARLIASSQEIYFSRWYS